MTNSVSNNNSRPVAPPPYGITQDKLPDTPQDSKAACRTPKETKAAVKNCFGGLPRKPDGASGEKTEKDRTDTPKRHCKSKCGGDKKPHSEGKAPGNAQPPVVPQPTAGPDTAPMEDAGAAPDALPPATGDAQNLPPSGVPNAAEAAPAPANAPYNPPAKTVELPATALQNFPQGSARGDPAKIKDELFDDQGNFDTTRLYNAAAKYDARDIYTALINSSKYGGWDALGGNLSLDPEHEAVQPTQEKAREALVGLAAWQDTNGRYAPIRKGEVPPIVFYQGPLSKSVGGYSQGGDIYVNTDMDKKTPGGATNTVYHELNHAHMSDAFGKVYLPDGKASLELEVVTEFLVNEWTGAVTNSGYEQKYPDAFKKLEDVVQKMGNGDRNTGVDLLRRAYFAGDQDALRMMQEYLPPTMGVLPTY